MERNSTAEHDFPKKEPVPKPLLAKLVKWTVWVLLAVNLLLFILYLIGSYRAVPDASPAAEASQIAIIRAGLIVSVVLVLFSVYGFIIGCIYAIRGKNLSRLNNSWGYMISLLFGALMAFGASLLINAAGGNL